MISKPLVINNEDMTLPRKVFREMMSKDDYSKKYSNYCVLYSNPSKITLNMKKILEYTDNLIKKNGFNCQSGRYFLEYHRYHSKGEGVITSPLDWHLDDDGTWGAWSEKVITVIYYLKKDKSLQGGDLLYSLDSNGPFVSNNNNIQSKKIKIDSNMIIIMNGNMWHCPEDIMGKGDRELLVIQFPRVDYTFRELIYI